MKCLNLFGLLLCLITSNANAQIPRRLEDDLSKSFDKILYWTQSSSKDNTVSRSDSLERANIEFAKKLKFYAVKYPFTIHKLFGTYLLKDVDISTSSDGLLKIYSWDTWTGGTMHFFENVFQYKNGEKTLAVIDTPKSEGDNRPNYQKLYTFKANGKTYYLATTLGIGSSKDIGRGIQVLSIENGKLNTDTKIIKTKTGLHSQIGYGYDLSKTDEKVTSEIHFDPGTYSIYVPIVLEQGKLTNKYIVYKFTGQYFERVKN